MLERKVVFVRGAVLIGVGAFVAGCNVGFKHRYAGHDYTMTMENSEYLDSATQDMKTRFGNLNAEEDPAKLAAGCAQLQQYVASAPDPGHFQGAGEILSGHAREVCVRARHVKEHTDELAFRTKQRATQDASRAKLEQRDQDRRDVEERARLIASIERDSGPAQYCTDSATARAARRRHEQILAGAPAAIVREKCKPRSRSSMGEVDAYVCPATVDADVAKLGQYQLRLAEYPFPEDRDIRFTDAQCDSAQARLQAAREKLEATGKESAAR